MIPGDPSGEDFGGRSRAVLKRDYTLLIFSKERELLSIRAGASTRFTSTSTSMSTCNMYEYEYKYEYLIIVWVRVWVLVDKCEYKYEYWSMIYILYKQQYWVFQSLKRESSDSNKPGTKLQLPIVHDNSLCQYICLNTLCNLVQWHFNLRIATYWLSWLTFTTCCKFENRAKIAQYHEMCGK